jgi:NADH:ubiquinone oxidoreductase subunit H
LEKYFVKDKVTLSVDLNLRKKFVMNIFYLFELYLRYLYLVFLVALCSGFLYSTIVVIIFVYIRATRPNCYRCNNLKNIGWKKFLPLSFGFGFLIFIIAYYL